MKSRKSNPLAARIKKVMQQDDDVGKIAQATPVLIARSVELFVEQLCKGSAAVTVEQGGKTVNTAHLKAFVAKEPSLDFLKSIVAKAPELPDKPTSPAAKRQKLDDGSGGGGRGRGRGRGRSKAAADGSVSPPAKPRGRPKKAAAQDAKADPEAQPVEDRSTTATEAPKAEARTGDVKNEGPSGSAQAEGQMGGETSVKAEASARADVKMEEAGGGAPGSQPLQGSAQPSAVLQSPWEGGKNAAGVPTLGSLPPAAFAQAAEEEDDYDEED